MNLNKLKKRREKVRQKVINRDRNIIEKWQFINKIYDDLKLLFLIIVISAIIILIFRWMVMTDYGSFENWWRSGEQVEQNNIIE